MTENNYFNYDVESIKEFYISLKAGDKAIYLTVLNLDTNFELSTLENRLSTLNYKLSTLESDNSENQIRIYNILGIALNLCKVINQRLIS